jgi:hypothetical protein
LQLFFNFHISIFYFLYPERKRKKNKNKKYNWCWTCARVFDIVEDGGIMFYFSLLVSSGTYAGLVLPIFAERRRTFQARQSSRPTYDQLA